MFGFLPAGVARRVLIPFAAIALLGGLFVPSASAVPTSLDLELVPSGDPDGGGVVLLEIDDATGEVCFELFPFDIDPATAAHIHDEATGGIVVDLDFPTLGPSGCVMTTPAIATMILADPSVYYVNIHNGPYPGGAVRAQLDNALLCNGLPVTVFVGVFGMASPGDDVIFGTPAADDIKSMAGDDTICANGGDDIIRGGPGADTILGGSGDDIIRGGGAADTLHGEAGDDTILGQGGLDTIKGGDGNDTIDGLGAKDTIDGEAGNDIIGGQNGADVLAGGDGNDTIRGQTGPDLISGGAGDDDLFGGNGNDLLGGDAGDDLCAGNLGGGDQAEAASCEKTPGIEILF